MVVFGSRVKSPVMFWAEKDPTKYDCSKLQFAELHAHV